MSRSLTRERGPSRCRSCSLRFSRRWGRASSTGEQRRGVAAAASRAPPDEHRDGEEEEAMRRREGERKRRLKGEQRRRCGRERRQRRGREWRLVVRVRVWRGDRERQSRAEKRVRWRRRRSLHRSGYLLYTCTGNDGNALGGHPILQAVARMLLHYLLLFIVAVTGFDPMAQFIRRRDRMVQNASKIRSDGQQSLSSENAHVLPTNIYQDTIPLKFLG